MSEVDGLDLDTQSIHRAQVLGSAALVEATKVPALARMVEEVSALRARPTRKTLETAQVLLRVLELHGEDVAALRTKVEAERRALPPVALTVGPSRVAPLVDRRVYEATNAPRALVDFASVRHLAPALGSAYAEVRAEWRRTGTVEAVSKALLALPHDAVKERRAFLQTLTELPPSDASLKVVNRELERTRGFASDEEYLGHVLNAAGVWAKVRPDKTRVEPTDALGVDVRKKFDWAVADRSGTSTRAWGCSKTGCRWNMPAYSQNDEGFGPYWLPDGPDGSMLCAPTSAAMALAANLLASPPDSMSDWLGAFEGENMVNRTIRMAEWIDTDPDGGTDPEDAVTAFVPLRATMSYSGAHPQSFLSAPYLNADDTTPTSLFKQKLQTTPGIMVHFGRYRRSAHAVVAGEDHTIIVLQYERDGGHVIAVHGNDGDLLDVNDPWEGDTRWDTLTRRTNRHVIAVEKDGTRRETMEFLPADRGELHYFTSLREGEEFPFIDLVGGIENTRL